MPSKSFLSADSYATKCCSPEVSKLRRSPRLATNDLVKSVLNIPIYVPTCGVPTETYDAVERMNDIMHVKAYLNRGEALSKFKGRDARLARIINAGCLFIYLIEHPNLLKHYQVFREIVGRKRKEFHDNVFGEKSLPYLDDTVYVRTANIIHRIFCVINRLL